MIEMRRHRLASGDPVEQVVVVFLQQCFEARHLLVTQVFDVLFRELAEKQVGFLGAAVVAAEQ